MHITSLIVSSFTISRSYAESTFSSTSGVMHVTEELALWLEKAGG